MLSCQFIDVLIYEVVRKYMQTENTLCLKKTSPTFLAVTVTRESIVGFS